MYQIRVDEALRLLCPGDVIATAAYFHEPQEFLSKLHLAASVGDLTLWTVNNLRDYPIVQDDCGKITWLSTFFDRNARKAQSNKQATYVPTDLHRIGETMVMSCRPTVFVAAVPLALVATVLLILAALLILFLVWLLRERLAVLCHLLLGCLCVLAMPVPVF